MKSNAVEAIVGAVVLAVASLFFYYAYTASNGKLRNGYILSANFDRIDGLNTGNDVKLSGVKIGAVSQIEIDPKTFMAHVKLLINDQIKLPTDTVAEIISESFMGGKYVALVPGGSETTLTDGQQIQYTQAAVSWESMIGKFLFNSAGKADDKNPESKP